VVPSSAEAKAGIARLELHVYSAPEHGSSGLGHERYLPMVVYHDTMEEVATGSKEQGKRTR